MSSSIESPFREVGILETHKFRLKVWQDLLRLEGNTRIDGKRDGKPLFLTVDQVRELRDCLNAYLPEEAPRQPDVMAIRAVIGEMLAVATRDDRGETEARAEVDDWQGRLAAALPSDETSLEPIQTIGSPSSKQQIKRYDALLESGDSEDRSGVSVTMVESQQGNWVYWKEVEALLQEATPMFHGLLSIGYSVAGSPTVDLVMTFESMQSAQAARVRLENRIAVPRVALTRRLRP